VCVQEEHQQDMEEVLAARTLMGLSAVQQLSDSLKASVEAQRALADKVSLHPCPVSVQRRKDPPQAEFRLSRAVSRASAMFRCLSGGGDEGDGCVLRRVVPGAGESAAGRRAASERPAG